MIKLKIEKISSNAIMPTLGTPQSAGYDLYVNDFKKIYLFGIQEQEDIWSPQFDTQNIYLKPMERVLIGTGLKMQLDTDEPVQLEIRSRSGCVLKNGLTVANQPATIDQDYVGEIGVIIINLSQSLQKISVGDRIAQLVPMPVLKTLLIETNSIDNNTERGEGGFGSTGK